MNIDEGVTIKYNNGKDLYENELLKFFQNVNKNLKLADVIASIPY